MRVRANRHTFALGAILVCMWYAGAAQQNGGAYLLAFLTGATALLSWLHARANLLGLQLKAGAIPPAREGEWTHVPLVLTVGEGRVPRGVELTATGVTKPVFVQQLKPDQPTRVELLIPAHTVGQQSTLTVVARSHYPLGFFTASRVIEVAQTRLVLPQPVGDLPLPAIDHGQAPRNGETHNTVGSQGGGDDFAGVREWQAGDSLRQVDWKAYARGRPLVVKQWSGAPAGVVWLDWQALPLTADARAGQLAQWIDEAEQRGLRYGLRLPTQTLSPGHGTAHRLKCLESLAQQSTQAGAGERVARPTRRTLTSAHETTPFTAHPGLLMLGIALLMTLVPLVSSVPVTGVLALAVSVVLRALQQGRGWPLLPQWLRLTLIALSVGGTWLQQGNLQGLEAGIAILLAVTAGKVLEARTPRDVQVLGLLGWFLCLCSLTLDQGIGRSLYALAVFLLITTALVSFRSGGTHILASARVSGTLLAQALPFVLLLFVVFPRGSFDIARRLSRTLMNQTGMSANLDPGSVAALAKTEELAFYAAIENAPVPDYSQRYWRCLVLWQCNGLRWQRGGGLSRLPHGVPLRKAELRQTIMLEPHGQQWLPALDSPTRPLSHTDDHYLAYDDDTLRTFTTVDGMRRFRVGSHLQVESPSLPADHERAALQVPRDLPVKVRELARTFAHQQTPSDIVNAALSYFGSQGFRYTIEPGVYDPQRGMEEFLLERRQGFCEHYAASFATLMRLAGVPARVVMGYLGGDYNESSNYLTIRQSDAHAWTEVWLADQGWVRVDPTAALAPARLNTDLLTYLESGGQSMAGLARNSNVGRMVQRAQLYWDHLNYLWYERVVQFNEMEQSELFADRGLLKYRIRTLLLFAACLFLLPLLGMWLWISRRARHPNPSVREWQALCRRLGKAGLTREAHEGPLAYAHRAARAYPAVADDMLHAATLYVQQRYGTEPTNARALRRVFRKIRTRA